MITIEDFGLGLNLLIKKIDSLGKIGSKNFDWLAWENLTDESARLYSQLSVLKDIVSNLQRKWG